MDTEEEIVSEAASDDEADGEDDDLDDSSDMAWDDEETPETVSPGNLTQGEEFLNANYLATVVCSRQAFSVYNFL